MKMKATCHTLLLILKKKKFNKLFVLIFYKTYLPPSSQFTEITNTLHISILVNAVIIILLIVPVSQNDINFVRAVFLRPLLYALLIEKGKFLVQKIVLFYSS